MCGTVVRAWVARYHQSVAILIPCRIELVAPEIAEYQQFNGRRTYVNMDTSTLGARISGSSFTFSPPASLFLDVPSAARRTKLCTENVL